ncbi:peptidase domain-containing ABC transporter [Pedobacter cryoconitis]|uniref:ATP-binding cassette subfamily B protein n=1 Tax=Pedobacter cryoconitis TaxID=188932 RepID=A0A327SEP7_9SPHI|nr:peptidase domain-containing ABC transporter [Pedobacter cryoconitis]RAJ27218.1 ATP-binding cassette subfamily B protein [Pedobacter cryoconitis]
MFLKFPHIKQLDSNDCGPTCLRIIAKRYKKSVSSNTINNHTNSRQGTNLEDLKEQAKKLGFNATYDLISLDQVKQRLKGPAIIFWNQNHYVVIYKITRTKVHISDPASGLLSLTYEEFLNSWAQQTTNNIPQGIIMFLESTLDINKLPKFKVEYHFNFKFIYKYLKEYKSQLLQVAYSLLLASIIQLIIPFLTQIIVDFGIVGKNQSVIYIIAAAQLALLISSTSVEFVRSWALIHVSSMINIKIISDFLKKLMQLPISFFDSKTTGDLIQRIKDHKRVEEFITEHLLKSIFAIFSIVIFLSILYIYNFWVFLIIFIGSTIEIGCVFFFINKRKIHEEHNFFLTAKDSEKLFELMTSMQEIKLNNIEDNKRLEWEKLQTEIFNMNIKKLKITHLEQGFSRFFNYSQQSLVIFYTAISVFHNQMTLGTMVTIIFILGQLNTPITQLINFVISANYAKISLTRLVEIHRLENEVKSSNLILLNEEQSRKTILLDNVSFSYSNRKNSNVLNNISLEIPQGKTTAIVGTSGSGKTTLLKILLRIYDNYTGEIKVGDKNLDYYDISSWRSTCGAVLQDSYIFSDTIKNNIVLGDQYDPLRLDTACILANIYEYVNSQPLKYETKLGRTGIGLSQGQKQRILIARIFYKNPSYLFLDEATNSLDAQNELEIVKNLETYFKNKTVIIVAHRLSTVKNADKIVVLDKGRISEIGNHDSLILEKGKYYKLIKNQLELGT